MVAPYFYLLLLKFVSRRSRRRESPPEGGNERYRGSPPNRDVGPRAQQRLISGCPIGIALGYR